jgi:hypothetical protein
MEKGSFFPTFSPFSRQLRIVETSTMAYSIHNKNSYYPISHIPYYNDARGSYSG